MKKRIFVKNAAILTLTALLLRTVGIFFRIYLAGQIGAEGMGLHALIFTVYSFASAIATGGLSLAVTKLVSEDLATSGRAGVRSVFRKALPLALLLGGSAALALFFGADIIARYWLCDSRAALSLRILSLGLLPMALASCFKGYCMARRNAKTPSNAQLLEQAVRILAVLVLLKPMAAHGLAYACAAVVLGNMVSEIAACIYLAVGSRKDIRTLPRTDAAPRKSLLRLIAVLLPVAFTGHINTALHMTENLLVPQALTRFTADATLSLSQFGVLKGMALPALFFPASFLSALSALLVPELSEYDAKNHRRSIAYTAHFALRITFFISVLVAGVFMAYPDEIGQLLYKDASVGLHIAYLAPIVPFMYIESIATGLLHGLGQQFAALKYNLANSALRISAVLLFVPYYGIRGFLWIMICSNLFTSLCCLQRLFKVTRLQLQWRRDVFLPLACCCIALLSCHVYNHFGTGTLHSLCGMALFVLVFLILSRITGTLCADDFERLRGVLPRKKQKQ